MNARLLCLKLAAPLRELQQRLCLCQPFLQRFLRPRRRPAQSAQAVAGAGAERVHARLQARVVDRHDALFGGEARVAALPLARIALALGTPVCELPLQGGNVIVLVNEYLTHAALEGVKRHRDKLAVCQAPMDVLLLGQVLGYDEWRGGAQATKDMLAEHSRTCRCCSLAMRMSMTRAALASFFVSSRNVALWSDVCSR